MVLRSVRCLEWYSENLLAVALWVRISDQSHDFFFPRMINSGEQLCLEHTQDSTSRSTIKDPADPLLPFKK